MKNLRFSFPLKIWNLWAIFLFSFYFHKKKITFFRCWYPRTRREVHHHLCVPTLWRISRTSCWSSTLWCGGPKTPATVPRSRQLTTSMDQGKYRHHASKSSVILRNFDISILIIIHPFFTINTWQVHPVFVKLSKIYLFHLPWAAPFCNFSTNFVVDKNTSFLLYFYNFTIMGSKNTIIFYLESD